MDPSAFPQPQPQPQPQQTWQQQPLPDAANLNYNQPPLISPVSFESAPTTTSTEGSATAQIPVVPAQWPSEELLTNANATPISAGQPPHQHVQMFVNEAGEQTRYVFDADNAYWYPDDDASMAESDDEEDESEDEAQHLESNDLGVIVAKRLHNRPIDAFGTQMRTFSNFADANVLATYVPSSINSPLNDAQTASVFWYFVNVTGPSMSLFERRPVDPQPIFQGQPVPRSRQHIWTCKSTLPMRP